MSLISSIYNSSQYRSTYSKGVNKRMKKEARKNSRPPKEAATWQDATGLVRNASGGGITQKVNWKKLKLRLMKACGKTKHKGTIRGLLLTYYATPHWQQISLSMRAKYKICQHCGADQNLTVHHIHYRTVGCENPETDLKVLCWPCHKQVHELLTERRSKRFSTAKA